MRHFNTRDCATGHHRANGQGQRNFRAREDGTFDLPMPQLNGAVIALYAGNGWSIEALNRHEGVVARPVRDPERAYRPLG